MSFRGFFSPVSLIIAATLVLMIIPFLTLEPFVGQIWDRWQQAPRDPWFLSLVVIGLLASDMVLPVPSSVVGTYAGGHLGLLVGTIVVWSGLSLGAASGFLLGRWGSPYVQRHLGSPEEIERIRRWQQEWGPQVLVLTRGLPLLAEATVFLAGLQGLTWKQFLPATLLSNLGLAIAYAVFGHWAEQLAWLPAALAISAALPVLAAALVRTTLQAKPVIPHTPCSAGEKTTGHE